MKRAPLLKRAILVVEAEKLSASQVKVNENIAEEEVWTTNSDGSYSSRTASKENMELEKIKAEVKDGVLYITIPKASATSKVIDINVQ